MLPRLRMYRSVAWNGSCCRPDFDNVPLTADTVADTIVIIVACNAFETDATTALLITGAGACVITFTAYAAIADRRAFSVCVTHVGDTDIG